MTRYGYIYGDSDAPAIKWMIEYGCEKIIRDECYNGQTRPGLKELVLSIKEHDELVVPSMASAVGSMRGLAAFLELCRSKNIRLISIGDRIDSHDLLFGAASTRRIFSIISSIPMAISEIKRGRTGNLIDGGNSRCVKKAKKEARDIQVINMYLAGYTLDNIMEYNEVSLSTLFRILRRHNIERHRKRR